MFSSWIELDTDALRANLSALRRALSSGCELILVTKGNAYGHGLLPVAQCAWAAGVKTFVVDSLEQSEALRKTLPLARILLDGFVEDKDVPDLLALNVAPWIADETLALSLARRAARELKAVICHALVDTGLGAMGFPWRRAADLLPKLARTSGLKIVGLCSHFASSTKEDHTFADVQAARFGQVERECRESGMTNLFRHMSDGGGLTRRAAWDWDGVRAGAIAYGYGAGPGPMERPVACRPVLSWKTRLAQITPAPCGYPVGYGSVHIARADTLLGTFAAGYADGYRAAFGGRAHAVCEGRRVPVVGNIAMRSSVVDLGPHSSARVGDVVTLVGKEKDASVWADELAALCDTLPHEILVSIRTTVRVQVGRP